MCAAIFRFPAGSSELFVCMSMMVRKREERHTSSNGREGGRKERKDVPHCAIKTRLVSRSRLSIHSFFSCFVVFFGGPIERVFK